MDTLIQESKITNVASSNIKIAFNTKLTTLWETMEFNRFGLVPMLVVIVAALGGIAGAFAIQESPVILAIVVFSTGLSEALILAVAPMRIITIAASLSVLISLLTIIL